MCKWRKYWVEITSKLHTDIVWSKFLFYEKTSDYKIFFVYCYKNYTRNNNYIKIYYFGILYAFLYKNETVKLKKINILVMTYNF